MSNYYYYAKESALKSGRQERVVSRRRANKLRKRGEDIIRNPEGQLVWFMSREDAVWQN